jgi:hypothetical protein
MPQIVFTTHSYRLVNKCMRELLMLHFRKCIVLLNCLFVNVASMALIDILNALSSGLKDVFQFFSRNRPQNFVELFE